MSKIKDLLKKLPISDPKQSLSKLADKELIQKVEEEIPRNFFDELKTHLNKKLK
jgi:hypothetical protein